MFIIEDYPLQNPYYHTSNDTLDTLNLTFHYEVTRSLVAAIAHIAGLEEDGDGIPDNEDNCPYDYNPDQEDTYPPQTNDCGDVCECETDFDTDGDVDGTDAYNFKVDFGRSDCATSPPCLRDHECDADVDGSDAYKFKVDFGRADCPVCTFSCSY